MYNKLNIFWVCTKNNLTWSWCTYLLPWSLVAYQSLYLALSTTRRHLSLSLSLSSILLFQSHFLYIFMHLVFPACSWLTFWSKNKLHLNQDRLGPGAWPISDLILAVGLFSITANGWLAAATLTKASEKRVTSSWLDSSFKHSFTALYRYLPSILLCSLSVP